MLFQERQRECSTFKTLPDQCGAIGWVGNQLYAVIFGVREDNEGEYYHLVTLWKATKQEQRLYEKHS